MNRNPKWAMAALLVGLAGCSVDQLTMQSFAMGLVDLWCQSAAATAVVPDAVPAELDAVRADPAKFSPSPHPLASVIVGTKLDDLSGLAGCWGRYKHQTVGDAVSEEFAVLQFDLEGGTVTLHRYFTMPSVDTDGSMGRASEFLGDAASFDLPMFLTEVYRIASMADDSLILQGVRAEGAAIADDGSLVFSCLAELSSEVSATSTLAMLLTLQGDYLKEYNAAVATGSAEDLVPAEADEFADLWVRFDCSAD